MSQQKEKMSQAMGRLKQTTLSVTDSAKRTEYVHKLREILDSSVRRPLSRPAHEKPIPGHRYRVLSLDGGGIRCIAHAIVISRICQRFPSFLEDTQFFCACSGGTSVIATLEAGWSPDTCAKLMALSAEQTLHKNQGNGLTSVKYPTKWIKLMCDVLFGDLRVKDLPRQTFINSYLLDNGHVDSTQRSGEITFFTNVLPNSGDERVVDALLRSSSAPTFFRAYQGYLDGGIYCNNPASCAIPVICGRPPQGLGVGIDDVVCLSLGTGFAHHKFVEDPKVIDGGLVQWGSKLFDVFMTAQQQYSDGIVQSLLGDHVFRFMPQIPPIRMDDVRSIEVVKKFAETVNLDPLYDWIAHNWGP